MRIALRIALALVVVVAVAAVSAVAFLLVTLPPPPPPPSETEREPPPPPAAREPLSPSTEPLDAVQARRHRFVRCVRACSDVWTQRLAVREGAEVLGDDDYRAWLSASAPCAASCDVPETSCSRGNRRALAKRLDALSESSMRCSWLLREALDDADSAAELDVIAQELEDCEDAERAEAKDAEARDRSGALYIEGLRAHIKGDDAAAIRQLTESLALSPGDTAFTHLELAVIADGAGERALARRHAREYLADRPCGAEQVLARKLAASSD